MDPQTTWDELLAAYAASEWERVHELAEELIIWLQGGGFSPRAVTGDDMGLEWDHALATAGCWLALSKSEEAIVDDAR